jgi:hypothetical protein
MFYNDGREISYNNTSMLFVQATRRRSVCLAMEAETASRCESEELDPNYPADFV